MCLSALSNNYILFLQVQILELFLNLMSNKITRQVFYLNRESQVSYGPLTEVYHCFRFHGHTVNMRGNEIKL